MTKSYYAIIPANVRYDKNITPNAKLLYAEITALCNEKGYCWATNAYFAELYEVSKKTVSVWVNSLAKNGYIDVSIDYKNGTKEIDSRKITLKHPMENKKDTYPQNNGGGMEEKKDTPMEENVKGNNTINNNTFNNKYYIDIYTAEFEELWQKYPNKKGKEMALKAYIKARKNNVSRETIEQGIENYAEYCRNKDKQYIKHGSTWFNQQCWQDEYIVDAPDTAFGDNKYDSYALEMLTRNGGI